MAQEYIIGRTERVRELKTLLQEKHALYLSAFFCSGKTLLLDQLAKALDGVMLCFEVGRDNWTEFLNEVQKTPCCTLLIDSLHLLDNGTAQSLAALIATLGANQRVVMQNGYSCLNTCISSVPPMGSQCLARNLCSWMRRTRPHESQIAAIFINGALSVGISLMALGLLPFLDCRFKAELRAIADSTWHIAKAFGEENAR